MFKVTARTNTGKVIGGTTTADDAADALAQLHKAAAAEGHRIVKATVVEVEGQTLFKIKDAPAKRETTTQRAPAAPATTSTRAGRRR